MPAAAWRLLLPTRSVEKMNAAGSTAIGFRRASSATAMPT